MRSLLAIALYLCLTNLSTASTLKPFSTDGCSLWVDGTLAQPNLWRHCCVAHDLAYWQGGSKAMRAAADTQIQACVAQAQGPVMANYMYTNVRWGGSPYWINHYRWGYGWNYLDGLWPRGYKELDSDEQAQLDKLLPAALELLERDALAHPASPPAPPELPAQQ